MSQDQTQEDLEPWIAAIIHVAKHYRLPVSPENLRVAGRWENTESLDISLGLVAKQAGLSLSFSSFDARQLSAWRLPLVLLMRSGAVAVLESVDSRGNAGLVFAGDGGQQSHSSLDELQDQVERVAVFRPARRVADVRIDDYIKPYEKNWLWKIIRRDRKHYGYVMLASVVANTLGLAGVLFSMQVYDRVVPAESMSTLYVLFIGVLVAVGFDFLMRIMRIRTVDLLGKRADVRVSDRVFGHALRLKNTVRPKSTGTFVAQLRELEQVRELITSSTVTAVADLPFFMLFLVIFWFIAGPLVIIPALAVVALLAPGLMAQKRLAVLANEGQREGSMRNAVLLEAIQGSEDIKFLQAEQRFQHQWNYFNAVTADVNLQLRALINMLASWTQIVQGSVYAIVVFFGAQLVIAGDMTTGVLVASSILATRMLAPLASLTQILSKWQQSKVALESLNQIMELPVDNPDASKLVHKPHIQGHYRLRNALFKYDMEAAQPVLAVQALDIQPGEKIAILGKNGAGKSTLLQALSGLLPPMRGELHLDGVQMAHIDPADVRRDIGMLSQRATLFYGSVRENLTLGAPHIDDATLLQVLALTGADKLVQGLPKGLDHLLMEGGAGLSVGQRQILLLSRMMLRQPDIVLLDEPTASLDDAAEQQLMQSLKQWGEHKTLVMVTHKKRLLDLVDRVLVVDAGRVVLDGPKDEVVAKLSGQAQPAPKAGVKAAGAARAVPKAGRRVSRASESPAVSSALQRAAKKIEDRE